MLTPLDLSNKEFKKSIIGGYNEDEVNEFLDKIIEDYEKLYKENIELKDKIALLNEGIQHYKNIEEALQNTLLTAQQTAEDIKKNAYAKADNIVKEAEIKGQRVLDNANQEVIKVRYEYEDLKRKFHTFKARLESIIHSQLDMLQLPSEDEGEEKVAP